jgi:hypothetical protein
MVNNRELSINPVRAQRRKVVKRRVKRQADSRRCLSIAFFSSVAQPGDREYLRELYNVNHTEHGKPYESHISGIPTARKGDGSEGRGTKKKRMPCCNGVDRAVVMYKLQRYPTLKGANFKVVETEKTP